MGDLRENMKFDPTIRRNIEGFVSNRVTKIIVIENKSEKINYREVGTTGYITVPEEQAQDYQKIADELNAKYAAENQRDSESVDNDLIRLRRQQRVKDATEALQYFEPKPNIKTPKYNKKNRRFALDPNHIVNKKALMLTLTYLLGAGTGVAGTAIAYNVAKDVSNAKAYMEKLGTDDTRYAINELISEIERSAEKKLAEDLGANEVDITIGEGYDRNGPIESKISVLDGYSDKTYREFRVAAKDLRKFLKYARTHGNGHLSVAELLKLRQEILREDREYKYTETSGFMLSKGEGIGVRATNDEVR